MMANTLTTNIFVKTVIRIAKFVMDLAVVMNVLVDIQSNTLGMDVFNVMQISIVKHVFKLALILFIV